MFKMITAHWDNSADVITVINNTPKTTMTLTEFLSHCTACGGNWGSMFLTGIKALWPTVYDVIPNDMGLCAWDCLCEVVNVMTNGCFED